MRPDQHIDYEAMAQDAMRGIVRAVLVQVMKFGLLGDHHFYIAFDTQAPGVSLSKRLRAKYPVEMTIVLQYRFNDLHVSDSGFEVELTFDGIPERLAIPYKAIKVFYDPSVPYGLQFEGSEFAADGSRRTGMPSGDAVGSDRMTGGNQDKVSNGRPETSIAERRAERPKRTRPEKIDKSRIGGKAETPGLRVASKTEAVDEPIDTSRLRTQAAEGGDKSEPVPIEEKAREDAIADDHGGKVVDLSKFRKK